MKQKIIIGQHFCAQIFVEWTLELARKNVSWRCTLDLHCGDSEMIVIAKNVHTRAFKRAFLWLMMQKFQKMRWFFRYVPALEPHYAASSPHDSNYLQTSLLRHLQISSQYGVGQGEMKFKPQTKTWWMLKGSQDVLHTREYFYFLLTKFMRGGWIGHMD